MPAAVRAPRTPRLVLFLAGASLLCLGAARGVHAQSADPSPPAVPPGPASVHPEDSATPIIVVGRLIGGGDRDPVTAPVVLQGDALTRNIQPQIGAVLEHLPGVSASGFAPGVSRPILRGFEGARVQVLVDGIGSLDASSVSNDHAVSLDTLNVDRIDVLHGPQVLRFSSDPAGGVVNALDKRIPRSVPDRAIALDVLGSYGTAADAVDAAGAADVRLAPRLVAHVDGSYGHSNDLETGGAILSPGLRASVLAEAAGLRANGDIPDADALTAQADARGRLDNSQTESWSYGGGLAFIDSGGTIGVSVARNATDYGIPPRPGVGDDGGPVTIGLRQTRADLRAALNLGGFLQRLEFRGAYGDYHHTEFDGGVPSTLFANTAIDTRIDAEQAKHGAWSGSSGVQFADLDLAVTGDETLLPDTDTSRYAVFTLQRLELSRFDIELAGRYEHTAIAARPFGGAAAGGVTIDDATIDDVAIDDAAGGGVAGAGAAGDRGRAFDQWSGVAGVAWHPTATLSVSADFAHGERAPAAEELYIDGIHDATQSYERGNAAFGVERSNSVELAAHLNDGPLLLSLTGYATNFPGFITPVPTGAEIEGFPVYQFIQAKAHFRGFEAEGAATLARWGARTLKLDAAADYTHAQLIGIGPVPLIPPLRVRGGVEYGSSALSLRGEVEWNDRQPRIAANEYPVGAFTLVNAVATWRPAGAHGPLTLILSGDNLLDVVGRRAASETRDFVPIAGRDIKLTARFTI